MTQPVQEPLTQRAISQLTWGQNQLFRRPDPNTASTVSCFRAYRLSDPVTVSGNGTSQDIFWNVWENCDTDVFDPNVVGDEVTRLDVLLPGRYIFTWGVQYDGALDDSNQMVMQMIGNPVFDHNWVTMHSRSTNGVNTLEFATDLMVQTVSTTLPIIDPFDDPPVDQFPIGFGFIVGQISGTSEDIVFAVLDVTYEPADICEGPIES